MALVGGMSIIAAQSAYQAGHLIESLPSLTVAEPVVAVVVAALAFGEMVRPGLPHLGQVGGLVVLALGVIDLARSCRTPLDPEPIAFPLRAEAGRAA
jgi:hypothetical protein